MAITILVEDRLIFEVLGKERGASGELREVSFRLHAKRYTQPLYEAFVTANPAASVADAIVAHVDGWEHVDGADGNPAPFSAVALRQLLAREGLPMAVLKAWIAESAFTEKN